ncbi:MAG: GCD complex subunit gcd7 [Alyxoria varia]|nr:MAG: GCD complex subunit gcd7 [Alyxoria varia]
MAKHEGVTASRPGSELSGFLKYLRQHEAEENVDRLEELFGRGQLHGSRQCAIAASNLLVNVISEYHPKSPSDLLERIRTAGRRISGDFNEFAVGNVVRRALGLVREASGTADLPETNGSTSLDNSTNLNGTADTPSQDDTAISSIKEDVLDGLRELLDELDQADKQISEYAPEHIHAHETILTYGCSLTAQKFFLTAAKTRKFTLFQVEGYPNEHEGSHDVSVKGAKRNRAETARDDRLKPLTAAGVTVVIVPDSAVFALMARASKVVLPSQAVFANGGVVAAAGARAIARAARFHRTPVVVLSAIYRLTPEYPWEPDHLVKVGSPNLNGEEGLEEVRTVNPITEYLEPACVDLVVTNV